MTWISFVAALAVSALILFGGCYIEWQQKHCEQFDPATQTWIDRCAK